MEDNEFTTWLKEKYPFEADLTDEIAKSMWKVTDSMPFQIGNRWDLEIALIQVPNENKVGMLINNTALLFIGILAKSLLDSLSAHFESMISSEIGKQLVDKRAREIMQEELAQFKSDNFKKCAKCGSDNFKKSKFCDNCAERFTN